VALGGGIPLLALIATASGVAAPREPMMRVDFDAPAGCSSAEAFRRGVAARLERTTTTAGLPPARIQVRLTRKGQRVVGELRLSHEAAAPDTRTVEGATCDEVVDVLALTAALALQPAAHPGGPASAPPARGPSAGKEAGTAPRAAAPRTAGAGPPAPSRSGTASPAPRSAREAPAVASATAPPAPASPIPAPAELVTSPPPPPPPPAPPSSPAPAPTTPAVIEPRTPPATNLVGTYLEVGVNAAGARLLSDGPGPNLGGGVMLGLSQLRGDRVSRSLRAGWLYLPNDFLLHTSAVIDQWYAFTLTACPGWGLRGGAFDVQVCARGIGGWITAREVAVTNPRSASRAWLSAGALLRGGAALGAGFALELEAGVDAPLFHREFITTPPRATVAETPPVSLLVGIGLSRRL